jgi:hypothetical protein
MSEPTTRLMVEHLEFLGNDGISCIEQPCPICEAIRRLIEHRPRVTKEFVEKWKIILSNLARKDGEIAVITLESMFKAAGVEVSDEN